jgi:lysophospholipase L1-like esterase
MITGVIAVVILIAEVSGYISYQSLRDYHAAVNEYIKSNAGPIPKYIPKLFWYHGLNPNEIRNQLDSFGFKGYGFDFVKSENELRIIALGDSTTEGIMLFPNQTFPYHLERLLQKVFSEKKITVINAGIGGHNSGFNLAYLALRLIHFEPDIIIIKSGYNDYDVYRKNLPFLVDYSDIYGIPFKAFPLPVPVPFFVKYIYWGKVWAANRLSLSQKAFGNANDRRTGDLKTFPKQRKTPKNNKPWNIYKRHIVSMIGIARENGATPILLDLPLHSNIKKFGFEDWFKTMVNNFDGILKTISLEQDVLLVETKRYLDDSDFTDHVHNPSKGNLKIAIRLANSIAEILGRKAAWTFGEELPNKLDRKNEPGKITYSLELERAVDEGMVVLNFKEREISKVEAFFSKDGNSWERKLNESFDNTFSGDVHIDWAKGARYARFEVSSNHPHVHDPIEKILVTELSGNHL